MRTRVPTPEGLSNRTRPIPRTLHEAFGPYAQLDTTAQPQSSFGDRLVMAVSVAALLVIVALMLKGRL